MCVRVCVLVSVPVCACVSLSVFVSVRNRMFRPIHIRKRLCKLAPESVSPMVILDDSTPEVFI